MTHFTVGIIVPSDQLPYIEGFISDQMEPYNEQIEVEPYVCFSLEQAKAEIDRDLASFTRILERDDPGYNLEKCREIVARLRQTTPEEWYREYVQHHERFNAKGEPVSTYNPDSKWDWYRIGGRWDGWITGNRQSTDNGFNFSQNHETLANNMATTEETLARGVIPHALLTPDGEWHERGEMGWFGILLTETDDWESQAREILSDYPGHHVVIVDAHI